MVVWNDRVGDMFDYLWYRVVVAGPLILRSVLGDPISISVLQQLHARIDFVSIHEPARRKKETVEHVYGVRDM
jgi:hypothetical protein